MTENMEDGSYHTKLRTHTYSHVDISNLCHRRVGNHSSDIILPDGINRTEYHSCQSEHEQNVYNTAVVEDIKANHSVDNLDKQEYISLRYK